MVEIKFCGLTRAEDAEEAVRLGASYLGVIFAGGPRRVSPSAARSIQSAAPASVGRVGVFGAVTADSILATAADAGVDVLQLHGDPGPEEARVLGQRFNGRVWAVLRTTGERLSDLDTARRLFEVADAVVVDARVDGALGGTGVALPWERLAESIDRARRGGPARLVLAGGLRPDNVARAIGALDPDIVDVSSGVESSPGIKDHELMRAFVEAAR